MNQGLFESLAGRFNDGTPVEAVPLAERRIVSIKDNLTRIFNTREGLLPHLKNCGLPDITEIYRSMPHGVKRLEEAVAAALEKNEPRLRNVTVQRQEDAAHALTLSFAISGEVPGFGAVTFQTTFMTNGQSAIGSWKKV
ncbi:MAG: type VI secretion system baseplate subunit TssE [Chitinispirillaceae bacterium]|nr:type VI secretion system baseplate subunit TssE [Chitinispirillaceae bacterium]